MSDYTCRRQELDGAAVGLIEAAEWSALLKASPSYYWDAIESEINDACKEARRATLRNHQAAHLLAWAGMARDAALRVRAADRSNP